MAKITVGQLRDKLAKLPADLPVLVTVSDADDGFDYNDWGNACWLLYASSLIADVEPALVSVNQFIDGIADPV